MIIDSHAHIDEVIAWGWVDPPEALLPLMEEAGVNQAVIMTYRDADGPGDPSTPYIQEAVKRYPDRLVGYIRINPNAPGAIEALDQVIGSPDIDQRHEIKRVLVANVSDPDRQAMQGGIALKLFGLNI